MTGILTNVGVPTGSAKFHGRFLSLFLGCKAGMVNARKELAGLRAKACNNFSPFEEWFPVGPDRKLFIELQNDIKRQPKQVHLLMEDGNFGEGWLVLGWWKQVCDLEDVHEPHPLSQSV